jgi:hypothetical protein
VAVVADGGRTGWQDFLKSVAAEFEDYLRELDRLNRAYARGLQDLATTSSERLQDLVESAPARRREHGPRKTAVRRAGPSRESAAASSPHAALALDAPVGSSASAVFTVANPREEAVQLSFAAGPLVDASDASQSASEGFAPRFTFEPPSLELAAGSESTISVKLPLPARMFKAGREYRGEVRVIGGDGAVLDVMVRVRPRPARKSTSTKKAAAKRPARAPRTPPPQG